MKFSCYIAGRVAALEACWEIFRWCPWPGHFVRADARLMIAGLLAVLGSAAHAGSQWTITDLGTLGGTFSIAQGINDFGQVVGQSSTENDIELHAFVYKGGALIDLGGTNNSANAINKAGQVAGTGSTDGHSFFPFIYKNGVMDKLGGVSGAAWGINKYGHAVGSFASGGGDHAFVYRDGVLTDLGTLGGSSSSALDINGAGQVVGNSATSGDAAFHAFLYRDRRMIDLGTLGGSFSIAFGINDKGHVVGESSTAAGTSRPFLYAGNRMHDLGTLGGDVSRALGINNAGQVVGSSAAEPGGGIHAFLYCNGVMTDLNSLPAVQAAGWLLETANAINNFGQIVGSGVINGQTHAFLLSPTSKSWRGGAGHNQKQGGDD